MCLVGWLCFLTLEKWPFVGDILCIQAEPSPLVTLPICSRIPPMWAAWVLLFWWADHCGQSARGGWPLVQFIASPALCGVCQSCLGMLGHSVACCGNPQGSGARVGSLMGRAGFGVGGCMAWVPRSSVGLLVAGASSLHSWLQIPWLWTFTCTTCISVETSEILYPRNKGPT